VTAVDPNHFRAILEEERRRVAEAINYLHAENPGTIEDETEEVVGLAENHLGETASVTLDREIDYTLEENSGHVLNEIDDALVRLAEGTYGKCRGCGGEIPAERLEAMPWATQCIDCKRREERW
jgi:RNA polymerase-binding protein DksA